MENRDGVASEALDDKTSEFGESTSFPTEWRPQVTPTGPSSLFMPISSTMLPTSSVEASTLQPSTPAPFSTSLAKKAVKKKLPLVETSIQNSDDLQTEGSNIHFSADGRKLCSYSRKLCKQRRMEGRSFCIKHILEDPNSGFHQCEYICKKKSGKRCTNPVPKEEIESSYCSHHRQIMGLQPRKSTHKRGGAKKKVGTRSKEAHHRLVEILIKQGIPQVSSKRGAIEVARSVKTEGIEDEVVASDSSSDEFPSDHESSESDSEVFDGDAFFADTFLNQYEDPDVEPDYLRDAAILTEEETISRRKLRIAKLLKLYKLQYRRLQDILRTRHELHTKRMEKLKEKEKLRKDIPMPILNSPQLKPAVGQKESLDKPELGTVPIKEKNTIESQIETNRERDGDASNATGLSVTDNPSTRADSMAIMSEADLSVPSSVSETMNADIKSANIESTADQESIKDGDDAKLQIMMQHYPHVKEGKELAVAESGGEKEKKENLMEQEEAPNCILRGCKGKCVLLTNYCFAHILQDHNQKLFKGCTYISPEGAKCNYPILITQKPPICNGHVDLVGGAKRERRKRKASALEKQKKEKEKKDQAKQEKKPKQNRQKRRKDGIPEPEPLSAILEEGAHSALAESQVNTIMPLTEETRPSTPSLSTVLPVDFAASVPRDTAG